ncbi:DUF177 domain-containing protein [Gorillibacterium sp. CAU 1737]|uniref:YceD family protein n=1 Tax=Gorillibacterium sp. CAU 1737 TaxID=3140362 RepID=UPI0032619191
MQINVKELTMKDKRIQLNEKLDLSELLSGRQDLESFGELTADLTASGEDNTAVVEGTLRLPVTMVCSRCLGPARETLVIPFHERFTKEAVPPETEEEEENLHSVQEDVVELAPYVEEAVWMSLPYVPLCKDDCKGLCPVCGTNRNERDCGCSTDRIDPRFAGLADLLNKDEGDL